MKFSCTVRTHAHVGQQLTPATLPVPAIDNEKLGKRIQIRFLKTLP
jgi:hypothetical protein